MALGHGFHALSPENRFFFGEDPAADGKSILAAAREGGAKLKNENEMPDQRWSGV
jgi:hypothetical protein